MNRILRKIKEIKEKNRLIHLLESCKVNITIYLYYNPKNEDKINSYIDYFNKKNSTDFNLPKKLREETKKGIKEMEEDIKKVLSKIKKEDMEKIRHLKLFHLEEDTPELIKKDKKLGGVQYFTPLIGEEVNLKKEKEKLEEYSYYTKKLNKDKPKGLKFRIEIYSDIRVCDNFKEEDAKLLLKKGNLSEMAVTWLKLFWLKEKV